MIIDIDEHSGFCFGVVKAITKAEEELKKGPLYCVGDIVHNDNEMERLAALGLKTISSSDMVDLSACRVLFRAHGEPPSSYETAKARGLEIIDASCPVVLNLQREIKAAYQEVKREGGSIVIYGQKGHAEVVGLVGQTEGHALVVENMDDLAAVDFRHRVMLFSQTTKSLEGFKRISDEMILRGGNNIKVFDTICRKVANRIPQLRIFASEHDLILFVSGEKSSNGHQLYEVCKSANECTFFIQGAGQVCPEMFVGIKSVGIAGANSTPMRIMEEVREKIEKLLNR